jgi:hypothetical protein
MFHSDMRKVTVTTLLSKDTFNLRLAPKELNIKFPKWKHIKVRENAAEKQHVDTSEMYCSLQHVQLLLKPSTDRNVFHYVTPGLLRYVWPMVKNKVRIKSESRGSSLHKLAVEFSRYSGYATCCYRNSSLISGRRQRFFSSISSGTHSNTSSSE